MGRHVSGGRWSALAWLAPAAGVASGVLGNLLTDGWSWWVSAALVALSVIVTMGGRLTWLRPGEIVRRLPRGDARAGAKA